MARKKLARGADRTAPQLATLASTATHGERRYELKFDGYRILAKIKGGQACLVTRNGNDLGMDVVG